MPISTNFHRNVPQVVLFQIQLYQYGSCTQLRILVAMTTKCLKLGKALQPSRQKILSQFIPNFTEMFLQKSSFRFLYIVQASMNNSGCHSNKRPKIQKITIKTVFATVFGCHDNTKCSRKTTNILWNMLEEHPKNISVKFC